MSEEPKLHTGKFSKGLTKEYLEQLYLVEYKPIIEISQLTGCSIPMLRQLLSKYKLHRNKSFREAVKCTVKLTKEYLEECYIEQGKSAEQIGKDVDCDGNTVIRRLKEYGISVRSVQETNSKIAHTVTKEQLEELYIVQRLSTIKIGEMLGCTNQTVANALQKFDIPIRTISEANAKILPLLTKEFLEENYIKLQKSTTIIARDLHCNPSTVWDALKLHNIPRWESGTFVAGDKHYGWKGGITNNNKCIDCDKDIWWGAKRCDVCHSVYNSGANNSSWNGGSSFDPYSPAFTTRLKNKIRDRDGHKCRVCGKIESKRKFPVHHIDYNKLNCQTDNLITLCPFCHNQTNSIKTRSLWQVKLTKIITSLLTK